MHRVEAELAQLQGQAEHAAGPAQQRLHPGDELRHLEWLGEIIVGAAVETLDLVAGRGPGGQHQDRHPLARRAPLLQPVAAVPVGQTEVEHHGVEFRGGKRGGGLVQPRHPVEGEAGIDQPLDHELGQPVIVFHEQQAHRSRLPSAAQSSAAGDRPSI